MAADEAVLNAYFEAKKLGKPVELTAFERVPGFYLADFPTSGEYVVVHHGKIVSGKGLAAAEAYIHDIKLASHKPSAGDVIRLLILFEALPPMRTPAPDQYYDMPQHAELNPRIDDSGKLTLNYLMPHSGNAVANPQMARIIRWTLPLAGKLAWKSEELQFDLSK